MDRDILAIPPEYLRTGLLVSLLSVWVLAILFSISTAIQTPLFPIWNAAWLFYAVWLSLGLNYPNADAVPLLAMLRQWCLNCSAVFLLWAVPHFGQRGQPAPHRSFRRLSLHLELCRILPCP